MSADGPSGGTSLSPRLRAVLDIEVPILQSGMGGVAGPDLVAAVSNAGGLGVLAALHLEPNQVRAGIRRVRELTDRPFGVNIWLHDDVRVTPDPAKLSADLVGGSQAALNELRPRFGLAPTLARPTAGPDLVDAAIDVMLEEEIPVFAAAIGLPEPDLVDRFHAVGSRVVSMVATTADALDALDRGVDVIVAQGSESGGHRSHGAKLTEADVQGTTTLTLVPETIEAIAGAIPVVAAGGIVDGRGLAAMLALGADGVLLGTRFVATRESQASELWKRRLTEGRRDTTLTDGFTGQWARVLHSEFTDHWHRSAVEPLPGLLQASIASDLVSAAKRSDDDQMQPLYAGASAGLLADIPGAGEVVRRIETEARARIDALSLTH